MHAHSNGPFALMGSQVMIALCFNKYDSTAMRIFVDVSTICEPDVVQKVFLDYRNTLLTFDGR